tara:strand:+ start:17728 stop:18693 length:966 start_codon:yes stop_codon:yes gene_type:complete
MMKYFIGPMSKNVVDAVMEYKEANLSQIGFIPSRRQIAHDGGYVNGWNTESFAKYVSDCYILRDHAGPAQGKEEDDGYTSLAHDCENFNAIHIDPWKKYSDYQDGLKWTVDMIRYCYSINSSIEYEVGTEQSIREFLPKDIDNLLSDLERSLPSTHYEKINYCVIQSGTSLKENKNTGDYDSDRLSSMVQIVQKYGLMSKEHNGDYLPVALIKDKFNLGLDSINIAPEFGQIETKTYLKNIDNNKEILNLYWKICYDSNKWVKWVDNSFDPIQNKVDLINICGHYVLSDNAFISKIKSLFPDIDLEIKTNIKNKLDNLFYG